MAVCAPANIALSMAPPDTLATCTSPAKRLVRLVVVLGIKSSSASTPYFLYIPRSCARNHTALLVSRALWDRRIFSCAHEAREKMIKTTSRLAANQKQDRCFIG